MKFEYFSKSDAIAGGLNANNLYSEIYKPLVPYLWDDIALCLKYPDPYPRWQYLFLITDPNSTILWLYGILLFVLTLIGIYLFSGFEENRMNLVHALLMLVAVTMNIGMPYHRYFKRSTFRFFFLYATILLYFTVSVYNAFFFAIIMNPKYPQTVRTLDEIRYWNYHFTSTTYFLVCLYARAHGR